MLRAYSSVSKLDMYIRLQVAVASVPPPISGNDVLRHVLATWEATRNAISKANCCYLPTYTGTMHGTWIAVVGKSFSKVFFNALQPHQFRECVRNEMYIDDTPMEIQKF